MQLIEDLQFAYANDEVRARGCIVRFPGEECEMGERCARRPSPVCPSGSRTEVGPNGELSPF